MSFGSILKELRIKSQMTQKSVVKKFNELDNYNSELASIDIVSISRWERGVTIPSKQKMILALRTLDGDIYKLYKLLNLRNIESESKAYISFCKLVENTANLVYIASKRKFEAAEYKNVAYSPLHPLTKKKEIEFISEYFTSKRGLREIPLNMGDLISQQINGEIRYFCRYDENMSVVAHSFWVKYSNCQKDLFIEAFKNAQRLQPYIKRNKSFLYIPDFTWHNKSWFFFILDQLLIYLLNNNDILKVYISYHLDVSLSILSELGFKVTSLRKRCCDKKVDIKLAEIDAHILLSNVDLMRRVISA
ncbi:HTH cro/C1-type domain-containing protein [Vibrio jasicida]|uniref:HTH cro/C1-type domain-containing protein n=1 Tax=Vibrio jasicida TaxID=766224 RepID=A0AAU9QG85_9VIBR|nr:HTH cro/C1-type domain-containing protein [Vibrio jasicida]CAH1572259.1 HTH cro/C1-type domain-containing protein [Vibrio jasicida]